MKPESKVNFAVLRTSWRPIFIQVTRVNTRNGIAIDDSTAYVYIFLVNIIISIVII